jgi:hypothetical protein
MAAEKEFTPWDFLKLVKELNEHEAELKLKLAQAGVAPRNAEAPGHPA